MAQEIQRILIKYEADIKELKKDLDGAKKQLKDVEKAGSGSAKAVSGAFKSVGTAIAKDLKKDLDGAKKQLKDVEKTGSGSAKAMSGAFKSVGIAIAAAFSVQQVIQFGKEMNQLQREAQGVRQAFNAAFDAGALDRMRKSTRGALSDLDLMKRALGAREFGIGPDLLAKGLEFARVQANKLGLEFDQLANDFVTGAGRQSIMILDNLGINQKELSTKVKETGDFYTALGEIIDEKMGRDGAAAIETLADRQNRLNASLENLRLKLSDSLAPLFGVLTTTAQGFVDAIGNLVSKGDILTVQTKKERDELNLLVASVTNAKEGTNERTAAIDELERRYPNFLADLNTEKVTNTELTTQLALANDEYRERIILTELGEKLSKARAASARLEIDQAKKIIGGLRESNIAIAEFGLSIDDSLTGIDRVRATQDALRGLFDTADDAAANDSFDKIAKATRFYSVVTDELGDAQAALNDETDIYDALLKELDINLTKTIATISGDEGFTPETVEATAAVGDLVEGMEQLFEIMDRQELDESRGGFAASITAQVQTAGDSLRDLEAQMVEHGQIRDEQVAANIAAYQSFSQEMADANRQVTVDAFSAGVEIFQGLAQLASDSAGLAKALLIFEKLVSVAQIVINLQKEIGLISANPALTSSPDLGASTKVPAIALAKARAAIGIATIIGTAIPELAFAEGTSYAPGSSALVGERGPEIMYVPKGARIFTAEASRGERSLIDAINEGRAGEFIESTYVSPALSGFAENMSRSAMLQNAYDDFHLRQAIKSNKTVRLDKATIRQLRPSTVNRFH